VGSAGSEHRHGWFERAIILEEAGGGEGIGVRRAGGAPSGEKGTAVGEPGGEVELEAAEAWVAAPASRAAIRTGARRIN